MSSSADKSPPRVISAELRRQLQQRFERARWASQQTPPDFRRAHELISEILRIDPGNILYIDLLLANLRRRAEEGSNRGWWNGLVSRSPLGARAAMERAREAGDWPRVLQTALEAAWEVGLSPEVLAALADVLVELEHRPGELRYRLAAVDSQSDTVEPVRQMALALERGGRFDDARDWWQRVRELVPDDSQANQRLESAGARGTAVSTNDEPLSSEPPSTDQLLHLARDAIGRHAFDDAQQWLTQASATGGGDLRIRESWEDLSLAQSEQRLRLARERAAADPLSETPQRLVAELVEEHRRLELGIIHSRCERFPQDKPLRLELARQLKRLGNYSGAVQRLEEVREAPELRQAVLVELGECWQHLRQFPRALDYYRQAIEIDRASELRNDRHLALYRGAVLAEAMGRLDDAYRWLDELVRSAGEFKDASERLDKLREICDKNGFPAGGS